MTSVVRDEASEVGLTRLRMCCSRLLQMNRQIRNYKEPHGDLKVPFTKRNAAALATFRDGVRLSHVYFPCEALVFHLIYVFRHGPCLHTLP